MINLSLAPFQGITDKIYRKAFIHHFGGVDEVYTPFISGIHPYKINPSKFNDVLPRKNNIQVQTVPQIVSTSPDEIIAFADFLHKNGYSHVNWNMGCPFSRLANKKRGCGLLPYPNEVDEILEKVMPGIKTSLSVKVRIGYHSKTELREVMHVFNRYDLKYVIIHPRTGNQLYRGEPDPEEFQTCYHLSKNPVVYNGNIIHPGKFKEFQKMFPEINHWMLGRGALINPLLAQQIRGVKLSDNEIIEKILSFHQEVFRELKKKHKSEERLVGNMKAIWYYMAGIFKDGRQLFEQMKVCRNMHTYQKIIETLPGSQLADNQEIENYFYNGLKHR